MLYRTVWHSGTVQRRAEEWADTGYRRWDRAGVLVEERALSDEELVVFSGQRDNGQEQERKGGVTDVARSALRANLAYVRLPLPTPDQTAAQVASLTRQMTALIRLVLDEFPDDKGED